MTTQRYQLDLDYHFYEGYRDGGDPTAPDPSDNRHPAYRHSFAVRRAEIGGQPIPAAVSRAAAAAIEAAEATTMGARLRLN
ncbi:hypothetical protein ACKU27_13620 [Sphingobium yanoikuyae]|uniref:hypothetical protein n=1 Tax=Sphingobium yanoikuyae TaxID=13690 RepID=UPI003B8F6FED